VDDAGAEIVKEDPDPRNVPPHDPEYQLRVLPLPPDALRVIVGNAPAQKLGWSTLAEVGAAGKEFPETGKHAGPDVPHRLDGVTQIFPDAAPTVTFIDVDPCPELIVQPAGTAHV